ncbi:arabinan endo-1,5-alpha-L-arabinosidase [Lapillicoccus sp.]|uniref:arabinan endo-1,5-alpha-L-arabinosidase n=1 Tax=Lapillicoccus sp. TaxID=1909287 RepID=UPI0025D716CD|nr:arabinan endo-1,5-alpha-L-arabinosidase [Lapillicoccus sp.]
MSLMGSRLTSRSLRLVVLLVTGGALIGSAIPTASAVTARAPSSATTPGAAATPRAAAARYPLPLPVTGGASTHDPSMIRVADGSYYVFSTHDGIQIRHSSDRTDWRFVGSVLPGGATWAADYQGGGATDLWAPDVSFHRGIYWLYYSVSSFGSNQSAIGLATSRTAAPGSWTDQGLVYASHDAAHSPTGVADDLNAIDPGLLVDAQGRWQLSLGSFWTGIKMIQLDPATGKPSSATPTRTSLAERPKVQYDPIEGAYIYLHDGWYYLFTSNDFCCQGLNSTYNIRVGRSRTPTGPYLGRGGTPMMAVGGSMVLSTHDYVIGPGGETVLHDRGVDWLVYHYYNQRDAGTPRLGINRITWVDGWPAL